MLKYIVRFFFIKFIVIEKNKITERFYTFYELKWSNEWVFCTNYSLNKLVKIQRKNIQTANLTVNYLKI